MSRTGLTRELLRWILSLGLSHPIKNARRDFSNGYLLAEILQRYYPSEVALHSFDNGATSEKRKSDNWKQLVKICKKKGLKLSPKEVEGVIGCNEDCLIPLLESVYKKVTSYNTNSSGGEKKDSPKARKPKREVRKKEVGDPIGSYAGQLDLEMKQKPRMVASSVQQQQQPLDHGWPAQAPTSNHFDDDYKHGVSYSPFKIEPMHGYSQHSDLQYHRQERSMAMDQQPSAASYQQQQQQHWDPFEFGKYSYERQVPIVASVSNEPPTSSPSSYYRDFQQENNAPYSYPQSGAPVQEHVHVHVDHHDAVSPQAPSSYYSSPAVPGNHHHASYTSHLLVDKENADSPKFAGVSAGLTPEHQQHRGAPQGYSRFAPEEKAAPIPATHFAPKSNLQKQKQVGIKKGSKYWELGKLGPDLERTEILEKRSVRDKMKEFSSEIRKNNARSTRRATSSGGKQEKGASTMDASKAYSARQRALEFAKNIPKPNTAQQRASTSPSKNQEEDTRNLSELDRLVMQHEIDSQQIDLMRNQLERQLKLASM